MRSLESKTRGRTRVEWLDLSEGNKGAWDPHDPQDQPLLRFDTMALADSGWVRIKDGSVLTQVSRSEDVQMREILLDKLLDRIEPLVREALINPVMKEGELFLPGGAELFSKLRWFGPEMAEEY